jgi:hypothetical protein
MLRAARLPFDIRELVCHSFRRMTPQVKRSMTVARMERSAIREQTPAKDPDFASLHPGYEAISFR